MDCSPIINRIKQHLLSLLPLGSDTVCSFGFFWNPPEEEFKVTAAKLASLFKDCCSISTFLLERCVWRSLILSRCSHFNITYCVSAVEQVLEVMSRIIWNTSGQKSPQNCFAASIGRLNLGIFTRFSTIHLGFPRTISRSMRRVALRTSSQRLRTRRHGSCFPGQKKNEENSCRLGYLPSPLVLKTPEMGPVENFPTKPWFPGGVEC